VPRYSAVDEAIITACPRVVFRALIDECSGATSWWAPWVRVTSADGARFDRVGATARSEVHNLVTARFTWRIAELRENELIAIDYLDGDLVGHGDLTLEPLGEYTQLRYAWDVRTNGLKANLLGPLLRMDRRHSQVVVAGFEGLNAYLGDASAQTGSEPSAGWATGPAAG
jgi:uncharacterized protein YndB with AHSA1/START domain